MPERATDDDEAGESIPVKIVADDAEARDRTEEPLAEAGDETARYLDQLKRVQAEFANFKRRTDRERSEFAAEGRRGLIQLLLPVLDDFDHFLLNHAGEDNEVMAGIRLIGRKLSAVLESVGLEQFAQDGDVFNPELHEAVLVERSEPEQDGRITEVWQPGYKFDGKLLRAAKVKVGRAFSRAGDE